MIKILFFIETLEGGGAEKVLRNLVNNMDQTRFDITVQTVWPCAAEKYLAPGIRYRSAYPRRSSVYEKLYRAEAEAGLTYRLHIKDDYDIECAYLEAGATKIMAASTNRRAVKLAWVHCDLSMAMKNPTAYAEKTRKYYEKFDRVICVSENVRDSFVKLYGDSIPADVLYNTVDDAEIREKAALPLPEGVEKRRLTAVSVGRLAAQKGYDRLLRAHKRLKEEGIRYDLWILGEGPDRPALEQYIRENGLADSVRLFGFQNNPYPFLREADVLVCSSRYEGFSTFVTEGVILGRPIVTTDCTGMRELLGDSEYGLLTENSEQGIYEGLRRMLTDVRFMDSCGALAKKRGNEFTCSALAGKTQQYIIEIWNQKHEA